MTQRQGYALARAELIHALTAYTGITTADGAVTRDTLIDANLIGSNDFIKEKTILIQSGPANNEDKAAISFIPGSGQINVDSAFSAQILAGTIFRILNISTVEMDVINILARIGTNLDAAGTATLFAWFAKIWAGLLGGQGLVYGGVVTAAVPGVSFTIDSLKGFGAGKFHDATAPYRAFVLRTALGTSLAPQGEMTAITGYTTATGLFTPNAPAFSVDIAAGDEVLILHPRLAEIKDLIDRLGAFTAAENLKAILGDLSTTKRLGQILGELDETDTLKAILGDYTAAANLKAAIDTLDGVVDAGFLAGAKEATVDAGFVAGAKEATLLVTDGKVDAGFLAGAKEAGAKGTDAIKDETALIKTQTDKLAGAAPVAGNTTANWQAAEANVVSIGANDIKNKVHDLTLSIHNLVGTTITVRLYKQVNGVERKCYEQPFNATTDPPGLPIVNGTWGIHEVLRCTLQSNNAADNGKAVDYDYMLEAM